MNAGQQILEWARQHGYTLAQMAEALGYPQQTLSWALHLNRITSRLADALFEHFGLRVAPTAVSPHEGEGRAKAPETSESQDPPYTEPGPDEAGGIAEPQPDAYPQEENPLDAYRREVRRILDKSRCRDI